MDRWETDLSPGTFTEPDKGAWGDEIRLGTGEIPALEVRTDTNALTGAADHGNGCAEFLAEKRLWRKG